ncbi:glycosyltransferase family 4 protein [Pontibacter locisalis]|uniref:Glycosyltransferase family 4 protein n=1 Tax=Pontibacter locisalis TaxID=1719035 RepID=A0ABW5IP20_9BACT
MKETLTIGISGPIDLKLLNWSLDKSSLPDTNGFPLTSHLINALLERGYKVIGYTNSSEVNEHQVLRDGNLTICIGRTKPQPGRRMFKYEREELTALMFAHPADVIYAFWTYEYAWAALDSGIPTIVSVHDIARRILLTQFDMFRLVRWYMNYRVLRRAKHLAANSNYTFKQFTKAEQERAVVLNNFYSSSFEKSVPKSPQKGHYIVSVSMGFTKRKGVPTGLHAFARLREKHPTLEYHLVGVGMEPGGEAQQYAEQHGLAEGVKFLGLLPLNEVLEKVAKAKVMLHASVEESFGMAVLEAMVMGTAVVGGEKSGFIPELLNHGKAGVLCDITSPEAIAEATSSLLDDENLMRKIEQEAAAHVKANFSEKVVVDKYLDCVNALYTRQGSISGVKEEVTREVA